MYDLLLKSIKAAIPGHPKPMVESGVSVSKSIKAAIPGHPKQVFRRELVAFEVYQSRDSRPSKARCRDGALCPGSLSKPRFPAIQSHGQTDFTGFSKSIKAAIPGHPKPDAAWINGASQVYQSRDSRPSKAPKEWAPRRATEGDENAIGAGAIFAGSSPRFQGSGGLEACTRFHEIGSAGP